MLANRHNVPYPSLPIISVTRYESIPAKISGTVSVPSKISNVRTRPACYTSRPKIVIRTGTGLHRYRYGYGTTQPVTHSVQLTIYLHQSTNLSNFSPSTGTVSFRPSTTSRSYGPEFRYYKSQYIVPLIIRSGTAN